MPLLYHVCHKIKYFQTDRQTDGQTTANLNVPPSTAGA